MRHDQRDYDELRSVTITPGYIKYPEGSVMIEFGDTKVICNASIEDRVPPFMRGQRKGWIAAEYAMLPRATQQRNIRESSKRKLNGRTMEIQRLIGRALRSVVDLKQIGERTVWVDCDVLQADGGTRTASITGAFVAVVLAFDKLLQNGTIKQMPVTDFMAAISVGITADGTALLDLNYQEDAEAAVDMNVVMTGDNEFIEIQGTGEESTFTGNQLQTMLGLAEKGMQELTSVQKTILGERSERIGETKQTSKDTE